MRELFESEDGKIFNTRKDCETHEKIYYGVLNLVHIFNKDMQEMCMESVWNSDKSMWDNVEYIAIMSHTKNFNILDVSPFINVAIEKITNMIKNHYALGACNITQLDTLYKYDNHLSAYIPTLDVYNLRMAALNEIEAAVSKFTKIKSKLLSEIAD